MNFNKIKDSVVFCLKVEHSIASYTYKSYYIDVIFLNKETIETLFKKYCEEYQPHIDTVSLYSSEIIENAIFLIFTCDDKYTAFAEIVPVIFAEEDYDNSQEIF